ncbi:hypothetical protein K431DRAFT_288462 [Polychaeton citri CBS 116435]|uniref:F-box domain-containing protein n=1 Tax=Polychaeton citri CBS 116435 TaxID=1314669 RepID=A0A9P4PZ21_9PEZI|nr:hypothetical protein K431DRAFT_288462 [Polychaeton citri CBS 116435]
METLPEEIISDIAAYTTATTVLSLSLTSRRIRSACLDAVVLRKVVQISQEDVWHTDSFDLEQLGSKAENNPDVWLRYAIADERAGVLSSRECPLELPERFMRYLPDLMILKHPFMYHACWKRFMRDGLNQSAAQLACLAIATLARKEEMPQLSKSLRMQEDEYLCNNTSRKSYIWALCSLILYLRSSLRMRYAVWPFLNAQVIPYIEPPTALEVLSHVKDLSSSLPIPFSDASRLANDQPSKHTGNEEWDRWFVTSSTKMASHDYLCDGEWNGYYTNPVGEQAVGGRWTDPPMTGIKLTPTFDVPVGFTTTCPLTGVPLQPLTPRAQHAMQQGKLRLRAEGGVDGVETFDLTAEVHRDEAEGEMRFYARKQYRNTNLGWDWDCRLTPFGIHGFWGEWNPSSGGLHRKGMIWLWKTQWTARRE